MIVSGSMRWLTFVSCGVTETREEGEELLTCRRLGVLPEDDLRDGFLSTVPFQSARWAHSEWGMAKRD